MAYEVGKGHLHVVGEPSDRAGGRIVAQYQAASRYKDASHAIEEGLGIWVVMEAVGADHGVEGVVAEGEVFRITDHEGGVGEVLGLGDLDHAWGEVETGELGYGELTGDELYHGASAASHVKQAMRRLFSQLLQDGRIVILAHLIDARMTSVVDLCGFGELLYREFLVLVGIHGILQSVLTGMDKVNIG
jgi:hypothetical protein